MFDLNMSWAAYFQGGSGLKFMYPSPPIVVLKLNFDGSFLRNVRRGRYGGLIRDSTNNSLCTYFCPVVVS